MTEYILYTVYSASGDVQPFKIYMWSLSVGDMAGT